MRIVQHVYKICWNTVISDLRYMLGRFLQCVDRHVLMDLHVLLFQCLLSI